MTYSRFLKIARATGQVFWPLVYAHVTPEEATYLRKSPMVRRNLDRRLFMALAHTLLSAEQLGKTDGITLEDEQSDIETGSSTATPFHKPIPLGTHPIVQEHTP